ncbi:putative glycosyltransferase [Sesbania bispinosa]|nr:putative glycosyltransferase [Sesbania bispinosa]
MNIQSGKWKLMFIFILSPCHGGRGKKTQEREGEVVHGRSRSTTVQGGGTTATQSGAAARRYDGGKAL